MNGQAPRQATPEIRLTDIRFTPASDHARDTGLLGFISCIANSELRLDDITLRLTRDGRRVLSWPCRRDRAGREHAIVAPLGQDARRRLEAQVFAALGLEPGGRP